MRLKVIPRSALVISALAVVAVWIGGRVPSAAQIPRPSPGASDRATFVGTYRLVQTEVKDDKGQWTRTPNFNSVGYITYADTGHMGVHIMPRNRPRFAANQPTPDEALAAHPWLHGVLRVVHRRREEQDRDAPSRSAPSGPDSRRRFPALLRIHERPPDPHAGAGQQRHA